MTAPTPAPPRTPPPRLPWWRTLGDRTVFVSVEHEEKRRQLARFLRRWAWRARQRDAAPWTDLGGEG